MAAQEKRENIRDIQIRVTSPFGFWEGEGFKGKYKHTKRPMSLSQKTKRAEARFT